MTAISENIKNCEVNSKLESYVVAKLMYTCKIISTTIGFNWPKKQHKTLSVVLFDQWIICWWDSLSDDGSIVLERLYDNKESVVRYGQVMSG